MTQTTYNIEIQLLQLLQNDDSKVPAVNLHHGESVVYSLEQMAKPLFRFHAKLENAVRIVAGGKDVTKDVDVAIAKDGSTLTLTVKPGTKPWEGKATFGFLNVVRNLLHSFDPQINNRGGG